MSYDKGQRILICLGLTFIVFAASAYPIFAALFGQMLGKTLELQVFLKVAKEEVPSKFQEILLLGVGIVALGVANLLLEVAISLIFQTAGHAILTRIRSEVYLKLLRLPVPFFDRPENDPGTLSSLLSSDTRKTMEIITMMSYGIFRAAGTLIIGLSLSWFYTWQISLITLAMLPLLFISILVKSKVC